VSSTSAAILSEVSGVVEKVSHAMDRASCCAISVSLIIVSVPNFRGGGDDVHGQRISGRPGVLSSSTAPAVTAKLAGQASDGIGNGSATQGPFTGKTGSGLPNFLSGPYAVSPKRQVPVKRVIAP
jgi:hypothetical protein